MLIASEALLPCPEMLRFMRCGFVNNQKALANLSACPCMLCAGLGSASRLPPSVLLTDTSVYSSQACADGGELSQQATELLVAAGFTEALMVEGGYVAWRKVFSTGGRRRPAGRWMPTGKEALKSGLPIEGAADSYEDVNPV